MKYIVTILLLLAQTAQASEIWLKVGETKFLPASRDAVIRVGSRGVVRIVDEAKGIRVIGLKPGTTTVVVGKTSHMAHVSLASQKDFAFALKSFVKKTMGLALNTDTGKPEVTGTLLRFSDWEAISEIAKKYQGEYVFKAQALPDVGQQALEHFFQLARKRGLPVVRFSANPEFTVHVPKAASDLKKSIHRTFASYGIAVDSGTSDIALKPLIRTRVILAEVTKGFGQEIGVGWPTEYRAQLLPTLQATDSLMVSLKALEARGQGQVLASPNLSCRSGGEAQFVAGGEFPIKSSNVYNSSVEWKQHGVILKVKPKADFQGSISLEIETELSLLDMAHAVDGIPALRVNKVKSHFDLPGKRTIALSGLIRQEVGRNNTGLPLLGSIPILGKLFSSEAYRNEKTELVVFVTPEIASPDIDEKIEMPDGWLSDGM